MKLEITSSGEATEVALEPGVVTLGGAGEDGIVVPGLAAGAIELRVDANRLMVRGREVFTVDDVLSPPGIFRLVLPGERIDLSDTVSLRLVPDKELPQSVGTAAVFKELLAGGGEPEDANSAYLVCLTGLDVGRRFPLCGDTIEVGRGDDVQIRVRDRAVSRKHARLLKVDAGYTIQELRTPNGLFVNGRLATRSTLLPDGAIIEMGQSLLRYRAGVEPPPPPPPEPEEKPEPQAEPEPAPAVAVAVEAALAPTQPRRAKPWELALIGVGVTLAVVGVLVSFSLLGAS